ncbi:MAG: hypothetical protein AAF670_11630 [Planctomycetota bacterium]
MAIRKHLTQEGYFGSTAKFRSVRLVAVARPGWRQVYRFEATARVTPPDEESNGVTVPVYHELFGLVQEDARHRVSDVRVFVDPAERQELFSRWSDGLICLRGAKGLSVS